MTNIELGQSYNRFRVPNSEPGTTFCASCCSFDEGRRAAEASAAVTRDLLAAF